MSAVEKISLPDIGDFIDISIIEVSVAVNQKIEKEDTILVLESDKATMEIPSPKNGEVREILVKVGDRISKGSPILLLAVSNASDATADSIDSPTASAITSTAEAEHFNRMDNIPPASGLSSKVTGIQPQHQTTTTIVHASPSVRRLARELGVDLKLVNGSGAKKRILKADIKAYVKHTLHKPIDNKASIIDTIDFSRFGEIHSQALSRIKKISGRRLQQNWAYIPHVTQFDEVDITTLEEFRQTQQTVARQQGKKLTLMSFLLKASAILLTQYPEFCASLSGDGEQLIYKKYVHIGVAVNTPAGLLVPVIRNVDQKGLLTLAGELKTLSEAAKIGRLSAAQMQGGCFTISSLGGIGGTQFTPIINAPELAILGVSKATMRPVYQHGAVVARLILPFSLSYDHRVIDGAQAAVFTNTLGSILQDIRLMPL